VLKSRSHCVKPSLTILFLCAVGSTVAGWGQAKTTNAPSRATGFSLPYKKEGKTVALFTGSEHKPLSVTLVQIKNFQVETYQPDGTPNLQGTAPECQLNLSTRQINSSGPLHLTQAGGAFTLSAVGFAWDQESERLQLSNRVQATFRLSARSSSLFARP